jgi:hypothetical protein
MTKEGQTNSLAFSFKAHFMGAKGRTGMSFALN